LRVTGDHIHVSSAETRKSVEPPMKMAREPHVAIMKHQRPCGVVREFCCSQKYVRGTSSVPLRWVATRSSHVSSR
jgi:hypothetical protein